MSADKRTIRRKPAPDPEGDGRKAAFHVAVRLTPEQLARVDALIPVLSTTWFTASRSDALRAVIETGLPIVERAEKGSIR